MLRLCFDYGHGGPDPGAIYGERRESMDNLNLGKELAKKLRSYGILVDEVRSTDKFVSLGDRCKFANYGKYDYFISFHRNAFKPEKAHGAETFVYTNASKKAHDLANIIQEKLVEVGFRNRGVKTANFQVLRGTTMPAVLMEIGFIDSSLDNEIFDKKRKDLVDKLSQAILEALY